MKWLKELGLFFIILVFALLVLLAPFAVRLISFDGLLMGSEPYYHARIASEIAQKGVLAEDAMVFDGRSYKLNAYHMLLAFLSRFESIELLSSIVPVFSGIVSVVFFYFLLKKLGFDLKVILFGLVMLIASPAFIATFTSSSPHCFAIFVFFLALYLFLCNRWYLTLLSLPLFGIGIFLSFFNAIFMAFFFLFYGLFERRRLKGCLALFFIAASGGFFYYYPNFVTEAVYPSGILTDILSDLGSDMGFGLFNLILAMLGFFVKWKEKKNLLIFYAMTVFFLLSAFFLRAYGNAYLNFAFAIFASFGFLWLVESKWEIPVLKDLTILVIICGMLFSSISYINRISTSMPDKNLIEGFERLHSYLSPGDVILSHPSYGFWIEYFVGNRVFMDGFKTPHSDRLMDDYTSMVYSRNLKNTSELLSDYNIRYIFITDEMKSGLVWSRKSEGLLFLFGNNETFKNAYDKDGIEIWEFIEG